MTHLFNIKIAAELGVSGAIMLQNLSFWQAKNEASERHFYDGRYWLYNSIRAFRSLFPYWSKGQINRILDSLVKKEAITVGNYNKSSYDRTKWFSVNRDFHFLLSGNEFTESRKPIPDINTYSKPDIKKNILKAFSIPSVEEVRAYCLERENDVDADKWHNFYEAKGWMIGKNKMKNWKAAVHTWETAKGKSNPFADGDY